MRKCLFFLLFLIVSPLLWAKDYYQILGVSRSATPQEIKKAYRSLAMKYHPDRKAVWSATMSLQQVEAKFKEINEANSVLSDEAKRAKFDRTYRPASTQPSNSGFKKPGPQPGAKKWSPQDFGAKPKPKPQVDLVAEYLKKMRAEFSAVKNKSAKSLADFVWRTSVAAKTQGKTKMLEALKKFMASTSEVFFATNPTIDDLKRFKAAYADQNFQLQMDKLWLEKASTRTDYMNRVKLLQGDMSRQDFLRKSGSVLDSTASGLWGNGSGSAEVFKDIDDLDNLEKMKAKQARQAQRPTYEKPTYTAPKTKAKPGMAGGASASPCGSPASIRAFEAYINTKIGPSKGGTIIDTFI